MEGYGLQIMTYFSLIWICVMAFLGLVAYIEHKDDKKRELKLKAIEVEYYKGKRRVS